MNSLRSLLLRPVGCLLLLAVLGWALVEGLRLETPAQAGGTKEALLLGGVTLVPLATPLVTTLLAAQRK